MTIHRKGLIVEVIGWSCHSVVLLVLESISTSVIVWARVRGIVGASFGVGGWVGWTGWGVTLLEGFGLEERLTVVWFSSSRLLDGDIPSSTFLAVGEMSFRTHCASEVGTFPIFGFDGFNRFSSLDAMFAILVVLVFSVGFASTESANRDTRFLARQTSLDFAILVLHACFMGASELPADVALNEVDSLLPVVRLDYGGKHDERRFDDLVCDGIVWVNDGEADVPMVSFVWNFHGRPIWFISENHVFEEWVGVFDFFQELFFGPELAHVHSVAVEFFVRDRPAWDLSIDQFVPNCRFGKRNMRIPLGKEIDDSFGCVFDVFVFGLICESNRKVVLLGPSSQNGFDLVHLLASYIDLVNNDVCWGLYAFPWGVPAEAKGVDLPMLEGRSFGFGVDWSSGLVWSVLTCCC